MNSIPMQFDGAKGSTTEPSPSQGGSNISLELDGRIAETQGLPIAENHVYGILINDEESMETVPDVFQVCA